MSLPCAFCHRDLHERACVYMHMLYLVQQPDTALQILIERCVSMGSNYQCRDMEYPWPFSAAVVLDVLPSLCAYCIYSLDVESHTVTPQHNGHILLNTQNQTNVKGARTF